MKNIQNTTLAQYYDLLDQHDWYYDLSDDRNVYEKGRKNKHFLYAISELSPQHAELLVLFTEHHFSGEPWGTTRIPKPKRPQE